MIARHARCGEAAAARRDETQRAAEVDAVERAGRGERRIGPDARRVAEAVAGRRPEAEDVEEDRVELAEPVVEVPGDEARRAFGNVLELLRAHELAHLTRALGGGEAEVEVEDVEHARSLRLRLLDGEARVHAAAALAGADREVDVAMDQEGPAAEDGVPVAP